MSFFNDVNPSDREAYVPAAQYFATRGFFIDYDARPKELLNQTTAFHWAEGFKKLREGKLDPNEMARRPARAGADDSMARPTDFNVMLGEGETLTTGDKRLTRGGALLLMWKRLR